jgi:hypothetical protein
LELELIAFQWTYSIVFVLLALGSIQGKIRIDREWDGGFQGAIEIPISNQVNNGWTLEIRFDRTATVDVRINRAAHPFESLRLSGMVGRSSTENRS